MAKSKPLQYKKANHLLITFVVIALIFGGLKLGSPYLQEKNANKKNYLSKDEALNLINNCEIDYLNQGDTADEPTTLIPLPRKGKNNTYIYEKQYFTDDKHFQEIKNAVFAVRDQCYTGISYREEVENPVYLSIEEATEWLNSCKLIGFYYTNDAIGRRLKEIKVPPIGTNTGILLLYKEDPMHIHISDDMITTMVPIARKAQKKCPYLQFHHDEAYEHRNEQTGEWQIRNKQTGEWEIPK